MTKLELDHTKIEKIHWINNIKNSLKIEFDFEGLVVPMGKIIKRIIEIKNDKGYGEEDKFKLIEDCEDFINFCKCHYIRYIWNECFK